MNKEKAIELLEVGKRKLKECKSVEGRKCIIKTNKHLKEIIKNG